MADLHSLDNLSVVSVILPVTTANECVEAVFAAGDCNALLLHARGTLVRNRWYQSFVPILSPEKEYLQFLVPDANVDSVMEKIVASGHLYLPGAGAVFSIPCDRVWHSEDFKLWSEEIDWDSTENASLSLRENLTAIFCVLQSNQTEVVSRAALQNGSHGPIIYFSEGRGFLDRLGWLRITRKHQEEVILLIVDNADADSITEAMVDAGRINLPGRGILYRMPIEKGLVNIARTYGDRQQQVNMQEIVSAIDNLMGNSHWRDQTVITHNATARSAGMNLFGKVKPLEFVENQSALTCISHRDDADLIIDCAIDCGCGGANLTVAKFIEANSSVTAKGIRINDERAAIKFVLPQTQVAPLIDVIQKLIDEQGLQDICFFTQPVGQAISYMGRQEQEKDVSI